MTPTQANPNPPGDAITEAFVTQLTEHRHRIYAFIAKLLMNSADAEDIFQRTSLVLWRKMAQFDPAGSFFHWACGIAYNEVRNFLTVQRRSKLYFDADLVDLLATEAQQEDQLSQDRLAAMRKCIATLAPQQQQILKQCYTPPASITTIAASLGRSRDALYKQLARLRQALGQCIRRRLKQEGVER